MATEVRVLHFPSVDKISAGVCLLGSEFQLCFDQLFSEDSVTQMPDACLGTPGNGGVFSQKEQGGANSKS